MTVSTKVKWLIAFLALLAIASTTVAVLVVVKHSSLTSQGELASTTHAHKAVYSCAMHPSITSDHPGKCPICGMDLQLVDEGSVDGNSVASEKPKKPLYYRNPMRGEITSPVPAKDEMGMDYIPVYDEEEMGSEGRSNEVSGRAGFSLSNERQQLIGVTTTTVAKRTLSVDIRASGRVAFDPDLFTAVEEYRQAVLSASQMKNSSYGSLKEQSDELVAAAETKLRLLGLTESQIRRLGERKKSSTDLILPKGNVWVYAEVFEYEVAGLKVGQVMEVTAPALPGKIFFGKVSSISPILNPQTRTVRVRAMIPDPETSLRPDTFVNVKIKTNSGERLVVPNDSVLHSGEQSFVFVGKEQGRFEPRLVMTGVSTSEFTEILAGVVAGETVVTSANFLIDSESRLRAAVRAAGATFSSSAPTPEVSHDR